MTPRKRGTRPYDPSSSRRIPDLPEPRGPTRTPAGGADSRTGLRTRNKIPLITLR